MKIINKCLDKNDRDRVGWDKKETAFTVHITELIGHGLNLAIRPIEFVAQILAVLEFTSEPEDKFGGVRGAIKGRTRHLGQKARDAGWIKPSS